jgi:hypothetical protein
LMIWGLSRTKAICLVGAAAAVALTLATLVPENWVPRTGLGFKFEHFSAYFVMAGVLCVVSRRPYLVAVSLTALAAILEALQGLTPDRSPDFMAPLAAAVGVACGVTLALLSLWARRSLLAALQRASLSSLADDLKRPGGRRAYVYSTGQRPR